MSIDKLPVKIQGFSFGFCSGQPPVAKKGKDWGAVAGGAQDRRQTTGLIDPGVPQKGGSRGGHWQLCQFLCHFLFPFMNLFVRGL